MKNDDLYNKGFLNFASEKYTEALGAFLSLIQLDPSNVTYWIALGATYQAKKEYNSAMAAYLRCLLLEPQNGNALFYCGQCAYALGNKADARSFFMKVVPLQSEFSDQALFVLQEGDL